MEVSQSSVIFGFLNELYMGYKSLFYHYKLVQGEGRKVDV